DTAPNDWWDKLVNPAYPLQPIELPDGTTVNKPATFSLIGCTVTSLATISTIYGANTDPLNLSKVLLQPSGPNMSPIIHPDATTDVNHFVFSSSGITIRTLDRTYGFGFIVQQLQLGNPVLIAVPWKTTTPKYPGEVHYVVAYGLNSYSNVSPSN